MSRCNKEIYRTGLVAQHIQHYWPMIIPRSLAWKVFQHVSDYKDAANRAMLLLSVGNAHNDGRLVTEGLKQQSNAVTQLRQQVCSAKGQNDLDAGSMLITILYLLLCEMVTGRPQQDREEWKYHMSGMLAIARVALPRETFTPEERITYLKVRQYCLMTALWNRRAKDVEHFDRLFGTLARPGDTEKITQLALRLPSLLEATDNFIQSTHLDSLAVSRLWSSLRTLEADLCDWHSTFSRSLLAHPALCKRRKTPSQTPGAITFKKLAFPTCARGHCMPCFLSAHCYAFQRTCLLLSKQALLDIDPLLPLDEQRPHNLRTQIGSLVESLCETVTCIDTIAEGMYTKMTAVQGLLQFLRQHFERTWDYERLDWCQSFEERLQAESSFVNWSALVPFSFYALFWAFDYDGIKQR